MRNDGGSSQPGGVEKHFVVWEGRFLRTGSVGGAAKVKIFEKHWDSTKPQAELPSPGLLPPRLGLLPRMAAAAALAPTPLDLLQRMATAAAVLAPPPRSPN